MKTTKLKRNLLEFDKNLTKLNETLTNTKLKFIELNMELRFHGYANMSVFLDKSNDQELTQLVHQIRANIDELDKNLNDLY